MLPKIMSSAREAVADIFDGAVIMTDGFGSGPAGIPQNLIQALRDQGTKNLTIIACTPGMDRMLRKKLFGAPSYIDVHILFENRQVKKVITCFFVPRINLKEQSVLEKQYLQGELEVEIIPQGTLAERIRAGGAGLGGVYVPSGVDTFVEQGKEKRVFGGKEYILELPLRADFALIKAYKADEMGNLVYRGVGRSYSPLMATAADVTIVETGELVAPGKLDPEAIVTPGIFVKRVVVISKEKI